MLAEEHPGQRLDTALRREVEEVTGEQEDRVWASHAAYLEDGGFVERHVRDLRGHDLVSWSATSRGVNLVDGLIEADPGIALGGE